MANAKPPPLPPQSIWMNCSLLIATIHDQPLKANKTKMSIIQPTESRKFPTKNGKPRRMDQGLSLVMGWVGNSGDRSGGGGATPNLFFDACA